jgi:ligand-binding sensor domain-containing protein/two-component sensor histidine kinase
MIKSGFYIWLIFIPFKLLAQGFTPDPDWRFENFNSQNHFISRAISDIAIDKNSYVWTSNSGVQRFDGHKTTEFSSVDENKAELRSNYADIAADNDGRIWVGSGGLCYYDDARGKFVYVTPDKNHPITYTQGFCFQKKNLWFVCNYGLARLNLVTLKISFTTLTGVTDPLGTFLINKNTLLVSSREKVYTYNINRDTYSTNTLVYNHSLVKIDAVAQSGPTIFVSSNRGLFTFNNLKDISIVNTATKDVMINDILFLPEDKEKKYLFLATEGKGVMVYNTVRKKIDFTYEHDESNPYSLPNNTITKLTADKKGRLWLSTGFGISMVDVLNQQLKMRFINKNNMDETGIDKIARDKYDAKKVWMSSFNQGMICVAWQTKKIEKIFNTNPQIKKLYDFVQVSKNKWLLATQKKVVEWNPRQGILSEKKLPVPDSIGLVYFIRRLFLTDTNTCFIATNIGLFKYDLISHEIKAVAINNKSDKSQDPLKYNLQNGFYDSDSETLWIASRNGLFSYNVVSRAYNIYRDNGLNADYFLFDVANAPNNRIACAIGDGISIFNKQTKTFTVINSLAHLNKPDCENVVCLKNNVWITSGSGILNYDLDTHLSAAAEHESSMIEIFPASPFTIIGTDIVFGFSNGYGWFTPDLKNVEVPSDPVLEGISVNNQPVFQKTSNITGDRKLVLTHSDNSITIAFTAFLYTDPDHVKFRYRLKGADSKWLYTDDQRSANYAQLPPGSYTFYLQSGNKNGVWNKHQASFNFVIRPPYWATWWFRMILIMLIIAVLYNLYRYKMKHILAIEGIRDSIASDFHDDLGSTLSSISIFSEVAIQNAVSDLDTAKSLMEDIGIRARAMIHSMNDMVWAIKPDNDNLYSLMQRMEEFSYPVAEAREMSLAFSMDQGLYDIKTDMLRRKNLFLIFKEAFNNAIKYSGAAKIEVSFFLKHKKTLIMEVVDNGRGFEYSNIKPGDGLNNLQKRAAEINGKLKITSASGCGTTINITCNIT